MEKQLKKFLKGMKLNENTISTVLGAVVLVVIGALIFNYFNTNKTPQISDVGLTTTPTPAPQDQTPKDVKLVEDEGKLVPANLPTSYTVAKGDHLWSIAEKFYKSGYNWVDIARENKLANASKIEVGQKLSIPKAAARKQTYQEKTLASGQSAIDGTSYAIVKGDSLWNISVRAYGDGFAWTRIYEANRELIGSNPGLIEAGMKLQLPR